MVKEERKGALNAPMPKSAAESKYSRGELLQAAASFGVKPEIVAGALRLTGKDEMTKAEAQAAVKKFLERKVE